MTPACTEELIMSKQKTSNNTALFYTGCHYKGRCKNTGTYINALYLNPDQVNAFIAWYKADISPLIDKKIDEIKHKSFE